MPTTLWAGLDLGLRETHVCIVDGEGATVHEQSCPTSFDAIAAALQTDGQQQLGLIATEAGSDTHVVRKLREAGLPVVIFEARKSSKFLSIRRNKTDKGDARGLADLGRLGRHTVSQVYLKSLECQRLRTQLATRRQLICIRVATENAIRGHLGLYGRPMKRHRSAELIKQHVLSEIALLKAEEDVDLKDDLIPLLEISESLRRNVRRIDRRLEKLAKDHPICRALMGVTGVGPICSLSFYSAIEDPSRFKRAADVAAYLGLVPKRHQSGDASYTKGITRTGDKMTRTLLVTAATVFGVHGPDSELKRWAAVLRQRIGKRRANVAVARKLAIILLTIWRTGAPFEPFPTRKAATPEPLARHMADHLLEESRA